MLYAAVFISIILGFLSSEFLGLLCGGLISAGYLAFYVEQPYRILSTLLLSIGTFALVKLLQNWLILFGRRRFVVTVLIGMLFAALIQKGYLFLTDIHQDMRIIGFIIPGLIANDMEKQGIWKTLLMLGICTCLIWMVLHSGVI